MTDEPTTPAAERVGIPEVVPADEYAEPAPTPTIAKLTLRCGDLRAQRDEARAERDQALLSASVRQDTIDQLRRTIGTAQSMAHVAYKERVGLHTSCQLLLNDLTDMENQRNEARARLARVEAAIAPWPPGARKGDVYRAIDGSDA